MCSLHPLEEEGGHPGPSHSRWTVTKALQAVCGSRAQAVCGARPSGGGDYCLIGQVLANRLPLRLLLLLDGGKTQIGKWRLTKQEVQIVQHYLSEWLRLTQKAVRTHTFLANEKVLKTKYNTFYVVYPVKCSVELNAFSSEQPLGLRLVCSGSWVFHDENRL